MRQEKHEAHKSGKIFHHQITEAMKESGEVFNTPDEMVLAN